MIAWWRDVGVGHFPRLSYMAVDFLPKQKGILVALEEGLLHYAVA